MFARMMPFLTCLICTTICSTRCSTAMAQGLRVSTHIYNVEQKDAKGRQPILSSSLSLFHNGRVYDFVETADEVIIFDPVEKKFTILNTARDLCTVLNFEEIRHLLDNRVPTVERYIQDLIRQRTPEASKTANSLRFQLSPQFEQKFEPASGTLMLTSSSWTYRVSTRAWEDKDQVERYLNYADWTARVNHLLHPGSMFPEPRVALNEALRSLGSRMPLSVELDLRPADSMHLRAEHRFTQNLDENDHARIARWEQMLTNSQIRKLSFRQYQETVLVSQSR